MFKGVPVVGGPVLCVILSFMTWFCAFRVPLRAHLIAWRFVSSALSVDRADTASLRIVFIRHIMQAWFTRIGNKEGACS